MNIKYLETILSFGKRASMNFVKAGVLQNLSRLHYFNYHHSQASAINFTACSFFQKFLFLHLALGRTTSHLPVVIHLKANGKRAYRSSLLITVLTSIYKGKAHP